MAGVTCLSVLACVWEPVQTALLSFLGSAVADSLSSLRNWAVGEVRNRIFLWRNQVQQVPISSAYLVGMEEIRGYLQEIGGWLNDDGVGMIGIYGMGGVGKTTLLEMINNNFSEIGAPGFQVVIWVTVSKDANVHKIQKSIGDRIGLSLSASSSQAEEQAASIFTALSKRRFLLLLDDVWEKLDLKDVGIPQPSAKNRSKIILTARSREVCRKMGTERLAKVKALNECESWKLFKKNVGAEVDLDSILINPHAKVVVKRCGGLPLALITVGRAMADANSRGEWQEAEEQLKETPHEVPGMKDQVLSLLKFSFDRLRDDMAKECLLYCCLFPEDYEIPVEQVIEYWVGEEFLDLASTHSSSIIRARHRGHGMITKLTSAGLLESIESKDFDEKLYVKMHDVVREMCLWLTGGQFDKNNTFLVCAGVGGNFLLPRSERWRDAKRISLMCNEFKGLPRSVPSCLNLQTLLYKSNSDLHGPFQLYVIERGIFEFMPALRVLDLSSTTLEKVPEEISFLAELRYLNLEETYINSLPMGLSKLGKLSQLNLDHTGHLVHVPQEVIPTLTRLRALGLFQSRYNILLPNEPSSNLYDESTDGEETSSPPTPSSSPSSSPLPTLVNMGDSESCWDNLEELRLTVKNLSSLQALLSLDRLCQCKMALQILPQRHAGMMAEQLSVAFRRLEKLQLLDIRDWSKCGLVVKFDSRSMPRRSSLEELRLDSLQEIVVPVTSCSFLRSLRKLDIIGCHGIRDLTWVRQLPCLVTMYVFGCWGIEELLPAVLGGFEGGGGDQEDLDHGSSSLHKLKKLYLADLPMLCSISRQPMLLSSLQCLSIARCPMLKKLPLGPNSAKDIRAIRGEGEWWEQLEWFQDSDGRSVRPRFLPYFRSWKSIAQEESARARS